jgi:hypothetical protein
VAEEIKPITRRTRYVVREVITDPETKEKSYVLDISGEYPGRDLEIGDVFEPVAYEPERVRP